MCFLLLRILYFCSKSEEQQKHKCTNQSYIQNLISYACILRHSTLFLIKHIILVLLLSFVARRKHRIGDLHLFINAEVLKIFKIFFQVHIYKEHSCVFLQVTWIGDTSLELGTRIHSERKQYSEVSSRIYTRGWQTLYCRSDPLGSQDQNCSYLLKRLFTSRTC